MVSASEKQNNLNNIRGNICEYFDRQKKDGQIIEGICKTCGSITKYSTGSTLFSLEEQ